MELGPLCKASLVLQQYLYAPTRQSEMVEKPARGSCLLPLVLGSHCPEAMSPAPLQCTFEHFIQSREMQAGEIEK